MDALKELREMAQTIGEPLRSLCFVVLNDGRFADAPASAGHHPGPHRERGGLALHTLEVARAAVSMSGGDRLLRERAFTAAVFHDFAKVFEYAFDAEGKACKLPFAKRTGHIAASWAHWILSATHVSDETREEIGHAILAHHGRKEWGSPVEPQTILAFILHTADMFSAKGLV